MNEPNPQRPTPMQGETRIPRNIGMTEFGLPETRGGEHMWPTNEVIKIILLVLITIAVLALALHAHAFG